MNGNTVIAVLRHNTKVETDVDLAAREIEALVGKSVTRVHTVSELSKTAGGMSFIDNIKLPEVSTIAFSFKMTGRKQLENLLYRSSFIQEIIITADLSELKKLENNLNVPSAIVNELEGEAIIVPSLYYLIESEGVYRPEKSNHDRIEGVGDLVLAPFTNNSNSESRRVREAIKTTLCLTHDLHVYKAKFFPRMVRALINIYAEDEEIIFDPFVGSGTLLLEASLLGYDAVGIDIDPISVRISDCKTTPFLDFESAEEDINRLLDEIENKEPMAGVTPKQKEFPQELRKKIRRQDERNGTDNLSEILNDATRLGQAIQNNEWKTCLPEVLASDAVTKKVRYRFVGVGNGSYTINILKRGIFDRLQSKANRCLELDKTFDSIESRLPWSLGHTEAIKGNAQHQSTWPISTGNTLILTSPPYLPASSGREDYSKSRSLSFYVLGEEKKESSFDDITPTKETHELAETLYQFPETKKLLDYLQKDAGEGDPSNDAMRYERKFAPTVEYLNDIRDFFGASASVLDSGGKLILIVAYQHTFYSSGNDEIEHVVDCPSLYGEIATSEGFITKDVIKMQLEKASASNAKPRSKDDYHEVALVFELI